MNKPKIDENLAEETGWHIGDGSMNLYKNRGQLKGFYQLRGHIEDDKQHYEKRIKPIFEKIYGKEVKLRKMPSTRVIGFQIWSKEIFEFKNELGLPSGKKIQVKIPKKLMEKKELRRAVIRGIFDTDGGIFIGKKNGKDYPRMGITTISFYLSEQVLRIFGEFGLRATRYSQIHNKKFNRKRAYIITIRGEKMFHKFMQEIRPKNPKHQRKYESFTHKTYK